MRRSDEIGDEAPSKTQVKQAMLDLQALGVELIELPQAQLDAIEMDDRLRDALHEARRITAHSARKRQIQYVSKLLRAEDPEPFREALAAYRQGRLQSSRALHDAERWRERLLAGDEGLRAWIATFPACDTPSFRTLLAGARRELAATPGRAAPDKGRNRNYRELFRRIKAVLETAADTTPGKKED